MAGFFILLIVVILVASKGAKKVEEIRANGRRNLIPVLIIALLIGAALAGGHS